MIVPPGHRRPTEAERTEDIAARRRALEQAERERTMSKPQLEQAWMELGDFEGYPREFSRKRPATAADFAEVGLDDLFASRLQEQTRRIIRLFDRGLADAEERQVIALLRARGYLIARPTDQLTAPQRRLAEQSHLIDTLRATIATLRAGGSVPPSAER